jgi:starvation-inducible outer membrane lipoprotein
LARPWGAEKEYWSSKGKKAMTPNQLPGCLIAILIFSMISGCAYPISKDWRELADPTLTFSQVLENSSRYRGEIVIWGGIISRIRPLSEGTEMIIIQAPLDAGGHPDTRVTMGRFLAKTDQTLDPKIYANGSLVTLAGMITGEKEEELGPMRIPYPVVDILELHLWKKKTWEDLSSLENENLDGADYGGGG